MATATVMAGGPGRAGEPSERTFSLRTRSTVHEAVQTEESFVPSMVDLKYAYTPEASEQFTQLSQLRDMIQRCMQEVAGNVYDVVSFKDVMFKMEEQFPTNLPVTDMLLLSSKLFRTTTELARLLGCFFGVVFADDHADEHFHFAEIRILQRELKEVKAQLADADEERMRLRQMLDNVGQVALDHGKAVELLENHNQALQLQTSALEDQMALLFRQLNSDLEVNCREAYEKVTLEMEVQERLNPTRITFRHTMDSLSQQIRASRSLIAEVREVLLSCSQGGRTGEAYLAVEPSVRFKLKMLDSNFQQLVGRFTSVKETVVETAQELMTALHERKRILYLSYQHIRLYDLQNAKLRTGKAVLSELRNCTNDLLQRVQATFPSGAITSVDRIGRITTQRWHGGYTLAALRQRKAAGAASGRGGGGGGGVNEPGEAGAAANASGNSSLLPGLSEAEVMAAESELAAFEEQSDFRSTANAGGNGSSRPQLHPGFVDEDGGELPRQDAQAAAATAEAAAAGGASPAASLGDTGHKTEATPFTNIHGLLELAKMIDDDIAKLNGALTLEDEMSAFLKTLTLSVTSTARTDIGHDGDLYSSLSGAAALEKAEGDYERALVPTGGLTAHRQRSSMDVMLEWDKDHLSESEANSAMNSPTSSDQTSCKRAKRPGSGAASARDGNVDGQAATVSRTEQARADALLARQAQQLQRKQEQLIKLQDDFSSKLGFLRQVYEARITDLEVKETTLKRRFTPAPLASAANLSSGAPGFLAGTGSASTPPLTEAGEAGPLPSNETSPRESQQLKPRVGSAQQQQQLPGKRRSRPASQGNPKDAELAMLRDGNVPHGADEEVKQLRAKTDREGLIATRNEWRKKRPMVESGRKMREATAAEIDRIEEMTESKKARKRADMTKKEL